MGERVDQRKKLDEYDDALMTSLSKDGEAIKREVSDAQGKP
jgi:hypothetical protein